MAKYRGHLEVEYPLVQASLNTRVNRARLKPGELSKAVGLDGRYVGGLRPFPGFDELDIGVTWKRSSWLRYVTLQRGTSQHSLRGFLILHDNDEDDAYTLSFRYYDENDSSWHTYDMTSWAGLTAASIVDVAGNGRFAYVSVEGQTPQTLYHDGTNMQEVDMGVTATYADLTAPGTAVAGAGGYLEDGLYRVGFRYYDSTRRVFSAIATADVEVSEGTGTAKITLSRGGAETPDADDYDQIALYRTLSADVAGTPYDAGILWQEQLVDLGADAWTKDVGLLRDNSLIYQEAHDSSLDTVSVPPSSGAIGCYEGMTVMAADTTAASTITELKFSPTHDFQPETFPITNVYRWSYEDGPVIRFVQAGDFLYGWTESAAYRIAKVGPQLMITRVHQGRGLTARDAVTAIGRDMVIMTPSGLMVVDGQKGSMQAVGAVEGRIFDDWAGHLDDVMMATDYTLACSIVVNKHTDTGLLLWHISGAVSELDDCTWVSCTEGPNPESGGDRRAWFLSSYGRVFYPSTGSSPSRNMVGLDIDSVTVNGTVTAGDANTVVDTAATGWTTDLLKGATVYVWTDSDDDPDSEPLTGIVETVGAGPSLDIEGTFSEAPAAGDRYCIAPIPLRLRAWNLEHPDQDMQDFGRRVSALVGILALDFDGPTDPDTDLNAKFRLGFCRNLEDDPADSVWSDFNADPNDDDRFQGLAVDGVTLEPHVEHISTGADFRLLSLAVTGRITLNRQVGDA